MTNPTRIQRQRVKGWRAPEGSKYVGRPTRFGNPFVIGADADDRAHATALYREWLEHNTYKVHPPNSTPEHRQAMDRLRDWILARAVSLVGLDLSCWCPLPAPGQPDHCHAAVLLELANQPAASSV